MGRMSNSQVHDILDTTCQDMLSGGAKIDWYTDMHRFTTHVGYIMLEGNRPDLVIDERELVETSPSARACYDLIYEKVKFALIERLKRCCRAMNIGVPGCTYVVKSDGGPLKNRSGKDRLGLLYRGNGL